MSKFLKLFTNRAFVTVIWFGLSLFAVIKQALHHHINNYLIYKYTFTNLIHQVNLYTPQPQFYEDSNHYGPLFALVIAPFTLFPDLLGCILWVMVNALVLHKAILMLPVSPWQKSAVLIICAHELMTASFNVQFNPIMAALIILSFIFIKRKQDIWAALVIVVGTYIKLYGVVGLAFFFFSEQKWHFIKWLIIWGLVMLVLPMLFSSPEFVLQSYYDWYASLADKNAHNAVSLMQDISVMGIVRRVFSYPQLSNFVVLVPAMLVFASSYFNFRSYSKTPYQLLILSSTLIFTVIFSTGSESPTYIIAFVGVAIWFVNLPQPVTNLNVALLVFALLITSLSPSDLFPKFINQQYIKPYALKALPCFLIWLKIVYESLTRKFNQEPSYEVAR
ncbi:glycosyltransferase family 87 protein [Mucilaginibacter lacusdianchii]|uniref:glycosyltransferase family 87 protein n=1 Tax=Mucilaginibacter lacusdianchii TaxID=2684211 RepID=UPI00131DAB78|nr:glycosyltransferase family 87 protein [Mucilaginibacter sp. JXJ CY 39]